MFYNEKYILSKDKLIGIDMKCVKGTDALYIIVEVRCNGYMIRRYQTFEKGYTDLDVLSYLAEVVPALKAKAQLPLN
ncbi:hypothetical protein [Proteus phage PM 116]|uniref:Uncharacterized protein n=1 Tax=Proteus phage PM 116 TaxID=1837877 RepID=A0A2D0VKE2_9CAUD|nr:hypothetical protein HOS11_gp17 [Proteus phage PM 116]ANU80099.1 hypothetical protein [Proteus phage PM 116]